MKNKSLIVLFCIVLGFFMFCFFIGNDRRFSDLENRYLEQQPKLSAKTLKSGEYMEKLDTYLTDQIMGRDFLISLKVSTDKLLGKIDLGNVYVAKDGYYVKTMADDTTLLKKNLDLISMFAKEHEGHVTFLLAPNVNGIYPEKLKKTQPVFDENKGRKIVSEKLKNNLTLVDATENLKLHKKENLYFKTDHHWTMRGAYYGYEALAQEKGWDYQALDEYQKKIVSHSFFGSLYSKAPYFGAKPDKIEAFYSKGRKCSVEYDEKEKSNSMFADKNLKEKDKYKYFLDGNHKIVKISSNCESGKKILIAKDSYSHVLIPFLADQFSQITVVDLRYFHDSLTDYMKENNIDDVLFIHNLDFLMTDRNFVWLQ